MRALYRRSGSGARWIADCKPLHWGVLRIVVLLTIATVASASTGTGSLDGVCTNTVTQRGVTGVTVTVSGNSSHASRQAVTDYEGAFRMQDLPDGDYLITLQAPGFAISGKLPMLHVQDGTLTPRWLSIQLNPLAVIRGRIFDQDSNP